MRFEVRSSKFEILVVGSGLCLMLGILSGCASLKEVARGVAGISTKVLEEGRKDAITGTVQLGYEACFAKTIESLEKQGAYIYSEDMQKQMIAFYVSDKDTTPVGVFLKEIDAQNTQWEVSSPSTYAKDLFAKNLSKAFTPEEEKRKDVHEGE